MIKNSIYYDIYWCKFNFISSTLLRLSRFLLLLRDEISRDMFLKISEIFFRTKIILSLDLQFHCRSAILLPSRGKLITLVLEQNVSRQSYGKRST